MTRNSHISTYISYIVLTGRAKENTAALPCCVPLHPMIQSRAAIHLYKIILRRTIALHNCGVAPGNTIHTVGVIFPIAHALVLFLNHLKYTKLANGYLRNLLYSIVMGATLLPCLKETHCHCITGSEAKSAETVGISPSGAREKARGVS